MRKIITEWTWDKLFDKCEEGLGEKDSDEYLILTLDGKKEWFKRIDDIKKKNYKVFGLRMLFYSIEDKIHNFKLRHLHLGKIRYKGKLINDEFEIANIP